MEELVSTDAMDALLAPVGIKVDSYELSSGTPRPTLSHIFWGQDLNEAIGNAKSHLITDYFFSSSFVGRNGEIR